MRRAKYVDRGLRLAVRKLGSKAELARQLGITAQSINQWRRIPRKHLALVNHLTGIPMDRLAPDLFGDRVKSLRQR